MPSNLLGIHVTSNAKVVKKSLQDLGAEIPKVGRLQIYNVMVRSKARLSKPGKKPTYPIKWDSLRQKIKVLIILRYVLREMPYRRRDLYRKAFRIIKQEEGYDLANDMDRASAISGDAEGKGQSRIFQGRYPIMREVIDEEMEKLPTAVVAHLQIVAKQKGFEANG
jgi:hypothetical protein